MISCTKCFEVQPDNNVYFSINKKTERGLTAQCKGCTDDYKKEYRKKNIEMLKKKRKELYASEREEAKEASRIYRINNPEKCATWKREHYDKNVEKIKKRSSLYHENNKEYVSRRHKEYRKKNAEQLRAQKKEYYERNKEKVTESNNRWKSNNIEKVRAAKIRYIHRKRSLINDFDESDWNYSLTTFNNACAYCGCAERLEQEHIIPVSKGGHYIASNIVPACRSCNASKGNKDMTSWYKSHEMFNHKRLDKIYEYIKGVQAIERSEGIPKSN